LEEFMGVELRAERESPEAEPLTPVVSKRVAQAALDQVLDRDAAAVALDQIAAGCSALAAALRS
jgi:hypothetical protein